MLLRLKPRFLRTALNFPRDPRAPPATPPTAHGRFAENLLVSLRGRPGARFQSPGHGHRPKKVAPGGRGHRGLPQRVRPSGALHGREGDSIMKSFDRPRTGNLRVAKRLTQGPRRSKAPTASRSGDSSVTRKEFSGSSPSSAAAAVHVVESGPDSSFQPERPSVPGSVLERGGRCPRICPGFGWPRPIRSGDRAAPGL